MQVTIGKSSQSDAMQAVKEAMKNSGTPKLVFFICAYQNIKEVAEIFAKEYPNTLSIEPAVHPISVGRHPTRIWLLPLLARMPRSLWG